MTADDAVSGAPDAPDLDGLRIRRAVRAAVLDPGDRVLLVRFEFPTRTVWATPGGGQEPGEDDEATLRRELDEELGLRDVEIGPHVWTRLHVIPFIDGSWDGQRDHVYLVRTPSFVPQPTLTWEQLRAERVHELRWWTLADVAAAGRDGVSFAPPGVARPARRPRRPRPAGGTGRRRGLSRRPAAGGASAKIDACARTTAMSDDDTLQAIREGVRAVCSRFDDDYWSACDQEHRFPWDFYDAMAAGGWIGIAIPERYGGGGQGIREAATVLGEVAASGACMNGASALHLSVFGMHPVVVHGTEEMKQKYLPEVAAGRLHVAFGVTEPDAGTDTTRISTRAVRDGDQYVINGRKVWTSKALEADRILLLTRTTPLEQCEKPTQGMTLFLVDRHAARRRGDGDLQDGPQRGGVVRDDVRRRGRAAG